jgi:hypothetical protein
LDDPITNPAHGPQSVEHSPKVRDQ